MKSLNVWKWLILVPTILILITTLSSCEQTGDDNGDDVPNQIVHTTRSILKDTIYETEVHFFESNKPGPRVCIVGGIHGDEIAGWRTALNILNRIDYIGSVMIIPKANILATQLEQRYPGATSGGKYNNVTYSDLNRSFPGKADGTITEKIANAIIQDVIAFLPEYIIDLHESRRSYSDPSPLIGDEVIYGNKKSAMLALEIVETFNERYTTPADVPFAVDANPPEGSFNKYCGSYFDAFVFTFETNRQLDLTKRMEQQNLLLDVFFELIWN